MEPTDILLSRLYGPVLCSSTDLSPVRCLPWDVASKMRNACKKAIRRVKDVRAVTLWDSEAHLTHRVLSLLNTFLRF